MSVELEHEMTEAEAEAAKHLRLAAKAIAEFNYDDASLMRSIARKYEGLSLFGPDPDETSLFN